MGLQLTSVEGKTAMFDSVTGWAFGPAFDTEREANSFMEWLEVEHGLEDARIISPDRLHELYAEWTRVPPEQWPLLNEGSER